MITGFILGATIMLIGVVVGHLTGKSWLDRQFARMQQQSKNKAGTTP